MDVPETSIQDLQKTSAVIEKLAANPQAFSAAYDAYKVSDAAKFEAALGKAGVAEECHIVCTFFCRKHCVGLCKKFCTEPNTREVDAAGVLAYAKAVGPLFRDEAIVKSFLEIMVSEDVKAWAEIIKKYQLGPFCYQLCALLFSWRCRKTCHELCPAKPLITRIGSIPISQIDALGYGNGPSIPPFYVAPPNPAAGYGDHPFGGAIWLMGVFNMAAATDYLVRGVFNRAGLVWLYDPIIVGPQIGYDNVPPQPLRHRFPNHPVQGCAMECPENSCTQSTGTDPGWFKISELTDSDGGRFTTGEKTLMMWPSPLPDGVYYLRLRVRDALMNTRVSSPQVVRLDNTGPFRFTASQSRYHFVAASTA